MARMPPHILTGASRARLLQVTFAGKLYVTGRHACFHAPAENVAFALAHDDLRSVAKLPSSRGASAGAPECRVLAVTLLAASWQRSAVKIAVCLCSIQPVRFATARHHKDAPARRSC